MKILYAAMEHDYGDASRGPSFEQTNFKSALDGMGHEVVQYDFMAREKAIGRAAMRRIRCTDLRRRSHCSMWVQWPDGASVPSGPSCATVVALCDLAFDKGRSLLSSPRVKVSLTSSSSRRKRSTDRKMKST